MKTNNRILAVSHLTCVVVMACSSAESPSEVRDDDGAAASPASASSGVGAGVAAPGSIDGVSPNDAAGGIGGTAANGTNVSGMAAAVASTGGTGTDLVGGGANGSTNAGGSSNPGGTGAVGAGGTSGVGAVGAGGTSGNGAAVGGASNAGGASTGGAEGATGGQVPEGTGGAGGTTAATSSCIPGVDTGDGCNPTVDTTVCVRSTRTCECGADGTWTCTPLDGQGGAGGTTSGGGGSPADGGGTPPGGAGGDPTGGGGAGGASGGDTSTGGAGTGGVSGGDAGGSGGGDQGPCPGSGTLQPGDTTLALTVDGNEYPFIVHAPPSYDGVTRLPVVFDFHGLGGDETQMGRLSGWAATGDAEGFITVFPGGIDSAWNAGLCCSDTATDVAFVREAIATLEREACIDAKRIYASGCSNGGGMSFRLACEAADVIAAVAPVDFDCVLGAACSDCAPARPITVVQFRGTNDSLVAYEGSGAFSGAQANFEKWGTINECTGLPEALPANSACETFPACSAGVQTILCTVQNGSHCGSYSSFGIAEVAWGVLQQHSLP